MKDILIYTTRACPYCIVAKRALDGRGIPHREIDITLTPHVRDELAAKTGEWTVPQIFVDGVYIGQDDELVEMVEAGELDPDVPARASTSAGAAAYDVAIIGAGRSGLAVALGLAGRGRIAVFERAPHIPGAQPETDAVRKKLEQAGVALHQTEIFGLESDENGHTLITLNAPVRVRSVVIATGSRDRAASLPGEEKLSGKGVSRCAECDGAFFTGVAVAVAGNGERAAHAVLTLAPTVKALTLLCPDEKLAVSADTRKRLDDFPNITVETHATLTAVHGDAHLTGITFEQNGAESLAELSGLFVYLEGNLPATGFVGSTVERGAGGALAVSTAGETATAGLFAAGTVARPTPDPEQVAGAISRLLAD